MNIEGHFSQEEKEKAIQMNIYIRRILKFVTDAKISILCQASIGNPIGTIKNCERIPEGDEVDINYQKG